MRAALAAGLALLLVAPACSREETFCDTVRALNDSSADIDVTIHGTGPDARERADRFAEAVRGAADRHLPLLDRLERTAPDDVREDVAAVVELSGAFARSMRDGDVAAVVARFLEDPARSLRAIVAYGSLREATARRCGEALTLAEANAVRDAPRPPPPPPAQWVPPPAPPATPVPIPS